jgi:hypothetical protein
MNELENDHYWTVCMDLEGCVPGPVKEFLDLLLPLIVSVCD